MNFSTASRINQVAAAETLDSARRGNAGVPSTVATEHMGFLGGNGFDSATPPTGELARNANDLFYRNDDPAMLVQDIEGGK